MKIKKRIHLTIFLAIFCWGTNLGGLSFAAGLSTRFGEVSVDNLKVGERYSLREIARLPLEIENNSDMNIEVKFDVLPPHESELRAGYEPIPDLSWIELENTLLKIGPNSHGETDVIINIPDDRKFEDKKYQVYIWSHTVGGAIGLGLKSRLLFSTTSRNVVGDRTKGDFEFDVTPSELVLKDVFCGIAFDVEKEAGTLLKIKNTSNTAKNFRVESIRVSDSLTGLPRGFQEAPDPSFLALDSQKEFTLGGGAEKQIRMQVSFPENDEYRGKDYLFVILISQEGANIFSKVYVSTAK